MKKFTVVLAAFASSLSISSCNNEEPNDKPAVSIVKPLENAELLNDYAFSVEGIATDDNDLASIHFKLSSPNASYNYDFEDSIEVSGSSFDYTHWITLPPTVSIGPAILEVYSKDVLGEESDHVTRDIFFKDQVEPVLDTSNTFMEDLDSIQVFFFKNTDGVYDSATIWNYTKATMIGTCVDPGGGFREIYYYRFGEGGLWNPQEVTVNLENETANPFVTGMTIQLYSNYTEYYLHPPYLEIAFKQYLPALQFNNAPFGHYEVLFNVTE
ncbi:hypothetical protein K6119_09510 [Paracrocinitomix mangrovi]|uniref:hypothetical protein n=1 Tax=Paracrocinitomix mangrovi TaxID=2862509 RepID=UPI001C8E3A3A|nr:hypothetical protein [Paracrocinitomix mangrovi]UKN03727.1 hypothetical protein K6119_09510 [Paracrocinitomix mangrovi]